MTGAESCEEQDGKTISQLEWQQQNCGQYSKFEASQVWVLSELFADVTIINFLSHVCWKSSGTEQTVDQLCLALERKRWVYIITLIMFLLILTETVMFAYSNLTHAGSWPSWLPSFLRSKVLPSLRVHPHARSSGKGMQQVSWSPFVIEYSISTIKLHFGVHHFITDKITTLDPSIYHLVPWTRPFF